MFNSFLVTGTMAEDKVPVTFAIIEEAGDITTALDVTNLTSDPGDDSLAEYSSEVSIPYATLYVILCVIICLANGLLMIVIRCNK